MTAAEMPYILETGHKLYSVIRNRNTRMTEPIRVLIVDDSLRARAGLRALLATWPEVEVVGEAINGQEAVQLVAENRPAIVLMDLEMPLMDGAQATRLIKHNWPDVTIIVITVNAAHRAAAVAAGADAFVSKGDAPERLLTTLRLALEGSRL
jgi:DNA-binding NarL/FixJ family response regulator